MPALRHGRVALRREEGVALVVAIGVMLVLTLVAAGTAALALNVKSQTTGDRQSVRALAAAESGLRLGAYYVNQSLPIADTMCPGTADPAAQTAATGNPLTCPAPYVVANPDDTTTSFTISGGATNAPLRCAGAAQPNIAARPELTYRQRCITSTGMSGGVIRRVQARLLAVNALFDIPGMVGIDHITLGTGTPTGGGLDLATCQAGVQSVLTGGVLTGTMLVQGSLGSNGTVKTVLDCWNGSLTDPVGANSARLYLGKSAPLTTGGTANPSIYKAQPGRVVRMEDDLAIPPIDTIFQTGKNGRDSAYTTDLPATSGNDNNFGMSIPLLGCPTDTYVPNTRTLNLSSTCVVTLQGNDACLLTVDQTPCINAPKIYNFCQINYPANGGAIRLPSSAVGGYVRLLLDSPDRTNSCPAGSGGLDMKNGADLLSNATSSVGAQIFIYGRTTTNGSTPLPAGALGSANDIKWQNSGNLKTLLVAPRARITFQNNAVITGGIAAWAIETQNNLVYLWDQNVDKVQTSSLYYRSSYAECARQPTSPSDPSSGC